MGIHEDLLQEGIDAESDGYYNQINKRMKEYFPQKFAESSTEETTKAAPVQNVASVKQKIRWTQVCETHQITGSYR